MQAVRLPHRKKIHINPTILRKQYSGKRWTLQKLAEHYDVSPSTVWLRMREANIPLRRRGSSRPVPSKAELQRLYHRKRLTIARLGSHYQAAPSTVARWLKSRGIARRKGAPARQLWGHEAKALRLHSQERLHVSAIARRLGVDRHTIRRFLTQEGISPHPAPPHRKKPPPPAQVLRELYDAQQWPISKVARHYGVRHKTARRWIREVGLRIRVDQRASRPGRGIPPSLAEAQLRQWYEEERQSPRQIAARVGLTIGTINNYLERYQIPIRGLTAANLLRRRLPPDDVLRRLHFEEDVSAPEIAKKYGVGEYAVFKQLRRLRGMGDRMRARQRALPVPEATLRRLYLDKGYSTADIGARYRVAAGTVRKWLRRLGIPLRPSWWQRPNRQRRLFKTTEEELRELYEHQKLSLEEVARQKRVSLETVRQRLLRFGIRVRSRPEAARSARAPKVAREALEDLYVVKGKSLDAVGRNLGVSGDTVKYWLKKYGLPARSPADAAAALRRPPGIPEAELRDLYMNQGLSLWEIGRRYGITPVSVKNWMVRYGIPRRSPREAALLMWRRPEVAKAVLRRFAIRPTRPEAKLSHLIERHRLPLRYVGDGQLSIDGKCPDFVGTEDPQAVIEVFGRRFHREEDLEKKRQFFAKRGYRLLVFWEDDLNYGKREAGEREAILVERVQEFLQPRSGAS